MSRRLLGEDMTPSFPPLLWMARGNGGWTDGDVIWLSTSGVFEGWGEVSEEMKGEVVVSCVVRQEWVEKKCEKVTTKLMNN